MGKNLKKKQFAVYNSGPPVTLRQGQGHQTWYELVDPKQADNNAKVVKSRLNSVREKADNKVFIKSGNMSIIFLEYMRKSKIVECSCLLDELKNPTNMQLNRIRKKKKKKTVKTVSNCC